MTTHDLDEAREAYANAVRHRKSLEHGGVCLFEDIQDWRKACDEQSQYADMLIPLLEAALAAPVERTPTMTDARIAEIRARVELITPGEWGVLESDGHYWVFASRASNSSEVARCAAHGGNARFIAYAPADIRHLLAALDAAAAQQAAAEAALRELYDAVSEAEKRIPIATEDWHHDLFAATGNAFGVLRGADHD